MDDGLTGGICNRLSDSKLVKHVHTLSFDSVYVTYKHGLCLKLVLNIDAYRSYTGK